MALATALGRTRLTWKGESISTGPPSMSRESGALEPIEELMDEHRVIERVLGIIEIAADLLDDDESVDPELFVDIVDFLSTFADKCHHSKEEKHLFAKMQECGVSGEVGPIAVMLREHQDGRAHVKKMAELSRKELTDANKGAMAKAARSYVELLSQHIMKEDNVLYPMARQILSGDDMKELEKAFAEVEEKIMGPGVHEKFHHKIEEWEKKYGR
jgi:hemerythrin-like domain-containing protein